MEVGANLSLPSLLVRSYGDFHNIRIDFKHRASRTYQYLCSILSNDNCTILLDILVRLIIPLDVTCHQLHSGEIFLSS